MCLFLSGVSAPTQKEQVYAFSELQGTGKMLWGDIKISEVAQMVKNLPNMETQVWSLGWQDPLEKEMASYTSILSWRIPWTEKPGEL